MEIKFAIAAEDLFCAQCQNLNIKTPTILEGSEYFYLDIRPNIFGCMDCFQRLVEEVNNLKTE